MKTVGLFLCAIAICGVLTTDASAQIPSTITYQGFLETGGQPVDGSVAMIVRLYTQAVGGTASWVGTFPTVSVNKGVYTIVLNPAGLVFDKPYYLETEVNGSVSASRTALTSVPYALGPWTPDSSGSGTISYSGKVGIGTGSTPQARLELQGDWNGGMPALRLAGNKPTIKFDGDIMSANKQWLIHLGANGPGNLEFRDVELNSVPVMSLSPASSTAARMQIYGQRGLETVGYQPYFTLTDANSGYTETRIQNAGGVMNFQTHQDIIGALPPSMELSSLANTSKLTLRAQDGLNTVGYGPFLTLTDASAGYVRSRIQGFNGDINFFPESFIGGSAAMVLKNSSGNVGIGTSSPAAKLDVAGSTKTQTLQVTGDATQARDKGGMVKAMALIRPDGTIAQCYNALTGISDAGCGITVTHPIIGEYNVRFGAQVSDRFISITPFSDNRTRGVNAALWLFTADETGIKVYIDYNDNNDPTNEYFFIFVY